MSAELKIKIEIPDLSVWRRGSLILNTDGTPKWTQRIRLRRGYFFDNGSPYEVRNSVRYEADNDPSNVGFVATLAIAKYQLGESWAYTRWEHSYECPDCCQVELKFFETDYADFHCEKCQKSFTRFGEQSSKHQSEAR